MDDETIARIIWVITWVAKLWLVFMAFALVITLLS